MTLLKLAASEQAPTPSKQASTNTIKSETDTHHINITAGWVVVQWSRICFEIYLHSGTSNSNLDVMLLEELNIKNWGKPIIKQLVDCPPIVNPSPLSTPPSPPQFQPLFCTNRAARPPLPLTQWCFCRHLSILETERQNPKFHGNYEILCCQGPCLHHNQQLLFYKREP